MSWLSATTTSFSAQSLLQIPELQRIAVAQAKAATANQTAIASRSASAAASSSSSPAACCTPVQCLQSALDYLLQLGSVVKVCNDKYEVTSLQKHVIPLVFHSIGAYSTSQLSFHRTRAPFLTAALCSRLSSASAPSDVGLHRDAVVAAVQSRYPQLNIVIVSEAIAVLVERSDICEWTTPLTYVCTNPAAAEGFDPSQ